MPLTPKQERFVQEYLVDLNATQAAIRAGYSAKTADRIGPELLGKTWVAAAISARQAKRADKLEISQDRVLLGLARIGFADIRELVTWKDGRLSLIDSDKLSDAIAMAIVEVSQGPNGLRVKLADKKGALVDLGKHVGLFTNKLELTGKVTLDDLVLEAARAAMARKANGHDSETKH